MPEPDLVEARAKPRQHARAWRRYAAGVLFAGALAAVMVVALILGGGGGDERSSSANGGTAPGAPAEAPSTYSASKYQLSADDVLFSPRSFWNRSLPNDAALAPDSEAMVGALLEEVRREQEAGTGPWIESGNYSTPIYKVPGDQPTVPVTLDGEHFDAALQEAFQEVPIPRKAESASGTDGHMVIWQPSTDRLWEFWQAHVESGEWYARWGGAIQDVSDFPGYYTSESWPGARHLWGATATGLPVAGGVMLVDELQAGEIDHALAVNLPSPRAGQYSWPAQHADGTGPPEAVPEGARLRLDPDFDVNSIEHPVVRSMAEAVQKHGMVVRDRTGSVIAFAAEDPAQSGENPYREEGSEAGLWQGEYPSEFLAAFPWEHLEVLELHLCSNEQVECPPPPEWR